MLNKILNCLEIRSLNYFIKDVQILTNIDLEIKANSITGLIGGSGSGKTTLFNLILKLPFPMSSRTNGEMIYQIDRKYMQPIFQDPASFFNPNWSLEKCLQEPIDINFADSRLEKKKELLEYLDFFSLSQKSLQNKILQFSGGELQRIAFVRALLCEPKILLLDEPVSGLDPNLTMEMMKLIRKLNHEKKISFLIISHDLDFIHNLCDFVYVIEKGKIVESGRTEDIFSNPQQNYTKLLKESRNLSNILFEELESISI